MADQQSTDLIMKFEHPTDGYVKGESTTVLNYGESDMATGFAAGNLIELQSFTFRTSVDGTDDESRAKQKDYYKAKKAADNQNVINQRNHLASGSKDPAPAHPGIPAEKPDTSGGSFAKWHMGQNATYQPEISPVEITRGIDVASTFLLDYCIRREVLKSATLIKRKAAGGMLADGTMTSGEIYLRFDFDTVLITKIDWDEDDPVKEKLQFISRAVTVSYRAQLPDGSLGAVVPGFFATAPDLTQFNLKGESTR